MDVDMRQRLLGAAAMAAIVAAGAWLSGASARASSQRVAELRAREVPIEEAQRRALSRDFNFKTHEKFYEAKLADDFRALGIETMTLDRIRQPNAYFDELDEPVVLAPGASWSSAHLRIRASVEKITFQQRGASVGARHSVATVENVASMPIAYYVALAPADERECTARGARMHNAMTLSPGESAEMAVCAGPGRIRVADVQVLEVTELGYAYVAKVPPLAVGYDPVTTQSHRPRNKVPVCTKVPANRIATWIETGQTRWRDVVDFYSRHDCDTFQFFPAYRHAETAVTRLPVVPDGSADG